MVQSFGNNPFKITSLYKPMRSRERVLPPLFIAYGNVGGLSASNNFRPTLMWGGFSDYIIFLLSTLM